MKKVFYPKNVVELQNDNERVTLEQQECETDTHTEKEKVIYTFIKNKYLNDLQAFVK